MCVITYDEYKYLLAVVRSQFDDKNTVAIFSNTRTEI